MPLQTTFKRCGTVNNRATHRFKTCDREGSITVDFGMHVQSVPVTSVGRAESGRDGFHDVADQSVCKARTPNTAAP